MIETTVLNENDDGRFEAVRKLFTHASRLTSEIKEALKPPAKANAGKGKKGEENTQDKEKEKEKEKSREKESEGDDGNEPCTPSSFHPPLISFS